MRKFIIKTIYVVSFIFLHNIYAMEIQPEFSALELRNESKFPATVTISYNMQGIQEEVSSLGPVSVTLAPISADGVQDKQIIPNPKRFDLVSVEVDGGIKFHNGVDLISAITVDSNGTVSHRFNAYTSSTTNDAPEWLLKSLTFKKIDLCGYVEELLKRSKNPRKEQKDSRYLGNVPTIHVATPEIITPFPLCLRDEVKGILRRNYIRAHPETDFSEHEIAICEGTLLVRICTL